MSLSPNTTPFLALLESPALGGSSGPDLTRYMLVCGGLLVLVAGLGFAFRKLVHSTLRARAAQRSMQVLDVLPMGGKQKLAVVRCYDRTFLIGVGDKELSNIAELDAVIAPAREPAPARADLHAFSTVLERLRARPPVPVKVLSKEGVLG